MTEKARLLNHTVPLEGDRRAALSLPADLTTAEADRLAAFFAALVIPTGTVTV